MTQTTPLSYDLPSWSFPVPMPHDELSPEDCQFSVNAIASTPPELWAADHITDHDLLLSPGKLPSDQPWLAGNYFDPKNCTPAQEGALAPLSLDELLRSTSQLATERALYMNCSSSASSSSSSSTAGTHYQSLCNASPPPLVDDPCGSPDMSHFTSEDDWDRHTTSTWYMSDSHQNQQYQSYFPQYPHDSYIYPSVYNNPTPSTHNANGNTNTNVNTNTNTNPSIDNSLTPLEMPDGSTRLTSNWLPVDPEGGFTISAGGRRSSRVEKNRMDFINEHNDDADDFGSDIGFHQMPEYRPDAFISMR